MCGRYALYSSAEDLAEIFRVVGTVECAPHYNVAPTQEQPVLLAGGKCVPMRWGLVPFWSKDGRGFINARAEGLFDKPAFRVPARQRRCLVPADGFFEWRKVGKAKQPLFFHRKDGRPFAMAGLWEPGSPPTFAVVTTAANALVAPVHDRMPAILGPGEMAAWLDPETAPERLPDVLRPWEPDAFEAVPVGQGVNDVRNDTPELVRPLAQASLFPAAGARANG